MGQLSFLGVNCVAVDYFFPLKYFVVMLVYYNFECFVHGVYFQYTYVTLFPVVYSTLMLSLLSVTFYWMHENNVKLFG